MYEATIGRFFSADPIGIEASDRNFYRYAGNDPTNVEDPSGLDPQTCPTTGGSSDEEFHFKPPNARGLPKGPLVYKMSCWADKELTFRYLAIGSPQWGSLTADRRSYVIGRQHHAASEGRKAVCIERNAKFLPESVVRKICEVSQERQQLLKETDWDRFFTSGVSSCEALIPPKAPFPPIPKPHPQFTTAIQPNCPASGVAPASETCKLSFVEEAFEPSFVTKYLLGDTPQTLRVYYSPDTPENRDIASYILRLKKLKHGLGEIKKDLGAGIEVADAGLHAAFDAVDNVEAVVQFAKKPCWKTGAAMFVVIAAVGVTTAAASRRLDENLPRPREDLSSGSEFIGPEATSPIPRPRGKLTGTLDKLSPAEKAFVELNLAAGKDVTIVPTTAARTPDFIIDGVRYELKTLSNVVDATGDGISSAIASRVMDGRGQAVHIIVDGRCQAGITKEIAERGIKRAFGADNRTGAKISSIRVIGPDFDIKVPRS